MHPLLRDGEIVFLKKGPAPHAGEIVVARHPFMKKKIVKRVERVTVDGKMFVSGAPGAESGDSSGFGPLSPDAIIGVVVGSNSKKLL